jgi:endogenous inhibitor of DNA gyrase (YacG/DUF329 family)
MPVSVSCPNCGVTVAWSATEKFRPFCSERCRLIDLGDWASDRYVAGGTAPEADDETEPSSPQPGKDG